MKIPWETPVLEDVTEKLRYVEPRGFIAEGV